ncbi:ribonuclease H-like domain-containing protein [Tanacetum coccineum]
MELVSAQVVAAAKLPVLNPGEFELWKMRIEQYFLMTDYALSEVMLNGDSPLPTRTIDGFETSVPPTTAEQKLARKNELKARGNLLMALPNEHQLKFNIYKSAKTLMEAIEKRFGGNKESKKVQKTLLKLKYENFNRKSSKGLDQIYDRLQKREIMGSSSTNQNTQNIAFVSSNITSSTNEVVKTAHDVSAANSKNNASMLLLYQMLTRRRDVRWHMLTMNIKEISQEEQEEGNLGVNGTDTIGFDKTKVECYNFHRRGHFARECRAPKNQDNRNKEITRRTMPVEETTSTCFKACLKSYETLKEHYDNPTKDFNKSQLNVRAYKAGLESIEARLDVYKKNEAVFEEDIKILKLDIMLRDNALTELRKKFEKAKKERDD